MELLLALHSVRLIIGYCNNILVHYSNYLLELLDKADAKLLGLYKDQNIVFIMFT